MTDPHEDLVAEATRTAFHTWDKFVHTPNIEGEPGLDRALRGFDLVARSVIALIRESTKDATPEMIADVLGVTLGVDAEPEDINLDGPLANDWRQLHRVSALWPKDKP